MKLQYSIKKAPILEFHKLLYFFVLVATKFTYKKRSERTGMGGRELAMYKQLVKSESKCLGACLKHSFIHSCPLKNEEIFTIY